MNKEIVNSKLIVIDLWHSATFRFDMNPVWRMVILWKCKKKKEKYLVRQCSIKKKCENDFKVR